jgi:hypothetical protein
MESDVDALYKLPLGEFTAARNALAARLKKAGRPAEADAVKALPKPSVSAWAVNQLFWRRRPQFDRLLDAGERLRKAQAAQLTRGTADVREPLTARREAAALLVSAAEGLLRDGGYGAARDMLRRVATTLEALSVYGSLPDAPRAGRLAEDVPMPGFETMAALLPGDGASHAPVRPSPGRPAPQRAGKPTLRAVPDAPSARRRDQERKHQLAEAKAAVRQAERTLRNARKQAERAAAAHEAAAQRAAQSDARRVDIEKQLAAAAKQTPHAHEPTRRAAPDAEHAARAADGATRAHDAARRALEQLEKERH